MVALTRVVAQISCNLLDIQYNPFMPEKYDPNIHHRRSIRIPGYDYSQGGWYFVTICTQNLKYMFGKIVGAGPCACPILELNNAGFMVKTWWQKVTNKFPSVLIDEYVVMPNHFHGIINIVVGATLCGRPDACGCLIPMWSMAN